MTTVRRKPAQVASFHNKNLNCSHEVIFLDETKPTSINMKSYGWQLENLTLDYCYFYFIFYNCLFLKLVSPMLTSWTKGSQLFTRLEQQK